MIRNAPRARDTAVRAHHLNWSETGENNPISRRRMLKLTAGTAAGLAMPGSGESVAAGVGNNGSGVSQLPPNSTTGRPVLPIPERLEGSVFHLDMRLGEREFLPAHANQGLQRRLSRSDVGRAVGERRYPQRD